MVADPDSKNPTSENPALAIEPVADPEFQRRITAVLSAWETNEHNFQDASIALNDLKQEAITTANLFHLAMVENTFGIFHGYRANYNQSIVHFEAARRYYQQAGAASQIARSDLNLGESYRLKGNYARARTYFHQAYERAKNHHMPAIQSIALTNEGQMWLTLESYDKARETLSRALELGESPWETPEPERQTANRLGNNCEIHYAFVEVLLHQEHLMEAWQHAIKAFKIAQQLNRPIRVGFANRALGNVVTRMKTSPDEQFSTDPDDYYRAALAAFKEVKAEGEVGKTLYAQGKSLVRRGKRRTAAGMFQQAMVIFTRLGMTDDAARAAEAQLDVM